MFKFKEGMYVIVNRTTPDKLGEFKFGNGYPKVGWIGKIVRPSTLIKEWVVEWFDSYNEQDNPNFLGGDLVREWMIAPYFTNFDGLEFIIGKPVIYTSGSFGDSLSNPLWNGKYDKVFGVLKKILNLYRDIETQEYVVSWIGQWNSNLIFHDESIVGEFNIFPNPQKCKMINTYTHRDILPLSLFLNPPKRNIKTHIEKLCEHLYKHEETRENDRTGSTSIRYQDAVSNYSYSSRSSSN
jgi:hypothetical protein